MTGGIRSSGAADRVQASQDVLARDEGGPVPADGVLAVFGVFVRSEAELERAIGAVKGGGLVPRVLDEHVETASGQVSVATMHLAKGLEFRVVVVMACDDEVIPLQRRIEAVGDDAHLQEVYDTERHLLYVACTRARNHLLVTGAAPASEFPEGLRATP